MRILFFSFLLLANFCHACCAGDDRVLTELLYTANNGTVFSCKILTSMIDNEGNFISTARVIEVYLGKVDSSNIVINSGNFHASTHGQILKPDSNYLLFTPGKGKYFNCCSICDRWTRQIPENPDSSNEVQIVRQFVDIFKHKRSGIFTFKLSNGAVLAEGHYKKGIACGAWKHYYEKDKLKSESISKQTIAPNIMRMVF